MANRKKYICVRRCFDGKLWEIGESRLSESDLTVTVKDNEKPNWRAASKELEEAARAEKKTARQLWNMDTDELILYTKNRFRGTILEESMSKTAMIKKINLLEKSRQKEKERGVV